MSVTELKFRPDVDYILPLGPLSDIVNQMSIFELSTIVDNKIPGLYEASLRKISTEIKNGVFRNKTSHTLLELVRQSPFLKKYIAAEAQNRPTPKQVLRQIYDQFQTLNWNFGARLLPILTPVEARQYMPLVTNSEILTKCLITPEMIVDDQLIIGDDAIDINWEDLSANSNLSFDYKYATRDKYPWVWKNIPLNLTDKQIDLLYDLTDDLVVLSNLTTSIASEDFLTRHPYLLTLEFFGKIEPNITDTVMLFKILNNKRLSITFLRKHFDIAEIIRQEPDLTKRDMIYSRLCNHTDILENIVLVKYFDHQNKIRHILRNPFFDPTIKTKYVHNFITHNIYSFNPNETKNTALIIDFISNPSWKIVDIIRMMNHMFTISKNSFNIFAFDLVYKNFQFDELMKYYDSSTSNTIILNLPINYPSILSIQQNRPKTHLVELVTANLITNLTGEDPSLIFRNSILSF